MTFTRAALIINAETRHFERAISNIARSLAQHTGRSRLGNSRDRIREQLPVLLEAIGQGRYRYGQRSSIALLPQEFMTRKIVFPSAGNF